MNRLLAIVDEAAAEAGVSVEVRGVLLARITQGVAEAGLVLTREVSPGD